MHLYASTIEDGALQKTTMFLGSNIHGPIKSIAGGIGSRSSSTDDSSSSSSSSSCSRGDISGPDDVREKEKSQTDICTSSYKLPTKTETDTGGAFVAAGDEQTRLAPDLTYLNLRPCPSCPQQQAFSYSGASAAARRQRPLMMHYNANIYEEEGEFDVLSEYTSSSSSSAAGTPNSDGCFFGGNDDFEEKEDSCIKHIPRLGEWRVMQDSTSMQQEAGAVNGAGSPRQRRVTSGVGGLNIVHEEDEAESVNIARHAAIGTLGVSCVQWCNHWIGEIGGFPTNPGVILCAFFPPAGWPLYLVSFVVAHMCETTTHHPSRHTRS